MVSHKISQANICYFMSTIQITFECTEQNTNQSERCIHNYTNKTSDHN